MTDERNSQLLHLTADIVTAHVSHNSVAAADVPAVIETIYATLAQLGAKQPAEETPLEPAVSIRASVKQDYIVCLEDGKKLKMLKRHLMAHYNMTPAEYRAKWNLPASYPMVAPAYAEARRSIARASGLGRKPGAKAKPAAAEAEAPRAAGKAAAPKKVAAPKAPAKPKAVAKTTGARKKLGISTKE